MNANPIAKLSNRRRAGISHAELLVCIAVLAVLLAALLPLVISKRSSEEANLAACKSNLHNLGIGILLYAQDNAGQLPLSPTIENPQSQLLADIAAQKYVQDPKLFYCPANQTPSERFTDENWHAANIGYFYYSAASPGDDAKLAKFFRTGIDWPHALNTRLDPKSWLMSDTWYSAAPTAHAAYKKGVNYLMLDGSVEFVADSPRRAFR